MRSGKSNNNNAEVNLEIQFNMNDDSFKIVHGKFGNNFPDKQIHTLLFTTYFTGISKDLSCLTTTEDISACEGKDYIQLMYFDDTISGNQDIDQWNPVQTFQNPDGNNHLMKLTPCTTVILLLQSQREMAQYCYVGAGGSSSFSSSCSSTYNFNYSKT